MKYFFALSKQLLLIACICILHINSYSQGKTEGLPITVEVKTSVNYTDGSVLLTGTTYSSNNEPGQIFLEITKPRGGRDNLSGRADKTTGKYELRYKPAETGVYKVTAYAADKKQTAETTFTVSANINTGQQLNAFSQSVDKTLAAIEKTMQAAMATDVSAQEKQEVEKMLQEIRNDVSQFREAVKKLKDGASEATKAAESQPALKSFIAGPLGKLSSEMEEKSKELLQVEKTLGTNKEKEPNICNTAYVIKESCALFSTVMNFASTSIIEVVGNIMVDKLWPKAAETLKEKKIYATDKEKFAVEQSGKLFLSARNDLKNIKNLTTGVGIAGDYVQYKMEQLMKKYCEEYKGPLTGDYTLEFRNNGKMYMRYKMTFTGKISVYCKKTALKGASPKLSGYIEGNVTKIDFTDDVWAVEDKSSWEVLTYKRFPAIVPPVNLSEKDPGFGAAARSVIPGSFYFPLQAQIVESKMVIRLMPALSDISTDLTNRSLVAVRQANNPLSFQWQMFSYPVTTARFILTRAMRMPDSSPTVTLDMKTKGKVTTIEKDFTRTETPADTKVDFNLKLKMTNAADN